MYRALRGILRLRSVTQTRVGTAEIGRGERASAKATMRECKVYIFVVFITFYRFYATDARKYAECALKMREEYPGLANVYYTLSLDEVKHTNMLHGEVVKLIENYKREKGEPPAAMMAIWEYKHEEHIDAAEEIAVVQAMFKKP